MIIYIYKNLWTYTGIYVLTTTTSKDNVHFGYRKFSDECECLTFSRKPTITIVLLFVAIGFCGEWEVKEIIALSFMIFCLILNGIQQDVLHSTWASQFDSNIMFSDLFLPFQ